MSKEIKPKIELKIVEPQLDHNFMIAFEGKTREECELYNNAIGKVLREAWLKPFHQVGTTAFEINEPGYHAWEVWKKVTKSDLENLLADIKKEAWTNLSYLGSIEEDNKIWFRKPRKPAY